MRPNWPKHYENKPIQVGDPRIFKLLHPKKEKNQIKNSDIFFMFLLKT